MTDEEIIALAYGMVAVCAILWAVYVYVAMRMSERKARKRRAQKRAQRKTRVLPECCRNILPMP